MTDDIEVLQMIDQKDFDIFIDDPCTSTYFKLLKKYASPYKLTNRGNKYYHDLLDKYMGGTPLNDDRLYIILGLSMYGTKENRHGVDMDEEIINEIGIEPETVINDILQYLYKQSFIEENTNYDEKIKTVLSKINLRLLPIR